MFFKVLHTELHPLTRVATVCYDGQNLVLEMFGIQFDDVTEGDVAIFEAPVAGVLLSMTSIVYYSCKCQDFKRVTVKRNK